MTQYTKTLRDTAENYDDFADIAGRFTGGTSFSIDGAKITNNGSETISYYDSSISNILHVVTRLTHSIDGTYGTLFYNSMGYYKYVPNDKAINALADGENGSDGFSITARTGATTTSQTLTINVEGADDPFRFIVGSETIRDTAANDDFQNEFGYVTASDDGEVFSYSITAPGQEIIADSSKRYFTHRADGTYGKLYYNSETGYYKYIPNDAAINALGAGVRDVDNFSVTATAATSSTRPVTKTLTINLIGADDPLVDDKPIFETVPTDLTIAENSDGSDTAINIGSFIIASDPEGHAITYSLQDADGNEPADFDIVSSSRGGQIRYKGSSGLDYETAQSVSLTVVATPSSGRAAQQIVTITGTDANDAPVFERNTFVYSKGETAIVLNANHLLATDEDVADSADQLTYRITGLSTVGKLQILGDHDNDGTTPDTWKDITATFNSFTQADINAGKVRYVPNEPQVRKGTSFSLTVEDGKENNIGAVSDTLNIVVRETVVVANPFNSNIVDSSTQTTPQTIRTGNGLDTIITGSGYNQIFAGRGNDAIHLTGGKNEVVYTFGVSVRGDWIAYDGADRVTGFRRGEDKFIFQVGFSEISGITTLEQFLIAARGADEVALTRDDQFTVRPRFEYDSGSAEVSGIDFYFRDAGNYGNGKFAIGSLAIEFAARLTPEAFVDLVRISDTDTNLARSLWIKDLTVLPTLLGEGSIEFRLIDPHFATIPDNLRIAENQDGTETAIDIGSPVTATHSGGTAVTYSLSSAPAGFEIDSATGQISYKGSGLDHEKMWAVSLTITAKAGSATTEQFITIRVTDEDEPFVLKHSALAYNSGPTAIVLDSTDLLALDEDRADSADQLLYIINSLSTVGKLQVLTDHDNDPATPDSWKDITTIFNRFTQADVNAGKVRYVPTNSEATTGTSFSFSVGDSTKSEDNGVNGTLTIAVRETQTVANRDSSNNIDLSAQTAAKIVYTGNGRDVIITGPGNDQIIGGLGNDEIHLTGRGGQAGGADEIIYTFGGGTDWTLRDGGDWITGFTRGEDKIVFRAVSSEVNGITNLEQFLIAARGPDGQGATDDDQFMVVPRFERDNDETWISGIAFHFDDRDSLDSLRIDFTERLTPGEFLSLIRKPGNTNIFQAKFAIKDLTILPNLLGQDSIEFRVIENAAKTTGSVSAKVIDDSKIFATAKGQTALENAPIGANYSLSVQFGSTSTKVKTGETKSIIGTYGTLKVEGDGTWTYTLNGGDGSATDALESGDTETDSFTFTYTHTDKSINFAHMLEHKLTINIEGRKEHTTSANIDQSLATDDLVIHNEISNSDDITIRTGAGNDIILPSTQNNRDNVYAGNGNDEIHGGGGNDALRGEGGNDFIFGNAGNDELYGGTGNDYLKGGAGKDALTGGADNDIFVLGLTNTKTSDLDIVTDFASGDKIEIDIPAGIATALTTANSLGNIYWTQNTDYSTRSGITTLSSNDATMHDTIIYKRDPNDENNDIVLMVLEDYNTALTIGDFDDQTPNFMPLTGDFTIAENDDRSHSPKDIGDPINAIDPKTHIVTYDLSAEPAGFTIDPSTGQIRYSGSAFDYEALTAQERSISFTVVATANGLEKEQAVTITITDVDEKPTALTLSSAIGSAFTGTSTYTKLADIGIIDDALGTNKLILTGGGTYFAVKQDDTSGAWALYLKAGQTLADAASHTARIALTADSTGTGTKPAPIEYSLSTGLIEDSRLFNTADGQVKLYVPTGTTYSLSSVQAGSTSTDIKTDETDVTGTYGVLKVNKNGTWEYTVNNLDSDTNALTSGQTGIDSFTFTYTGSAGQTRTHTLTVTIEGRTDHTITGSFDQRSATADLTVRSSGTQTITTGSGDDIIIRTHTYYTYEDVITTNAGDGDDEVHGSDCADYLYGGDGNDYLYGNRDDDEIYGDDGNDFIFGNAGNDYLYGGPGNDYLDGGLGRDILFGVLFAARPGNDIFVLGITNTQTSDLDIVTDFANGNNKIEVGTYSDTETTLKALKSVANIRWTQNTDYSTLGISPHYTNDRNKHDTIIYHTNKTPDDMSDDIILMVLEDYKTALTINDFVDEVPTAFELSNVHWTILAGTSTRRKLADIAITDDWFGTNTPHLTAGSTTYFEIIQEEDGNYALYLKAGQALTLADIHRATIDLTATGIGTIPAQIEYSLAVVSAEEQVIEDSRHFDSADGQIEAPSSANTTYSLSSVKQAGSSTATPITTNETKSIDGTYGTLKVKGDGTWTYTLEKDNTVIDKLDSGEAKTEIFTFTYTGGDQPLTRTLGVTIGGRTDSTDSNQSSAISDLVIDISGTQRIDTGLGDDIIIRTHTSSNYVWTFSGSGNDEIHGGMGKDYISSGDGNDYLYGGDGNDRLSSGHGNDTLYGGDGNDRLSSDSGVNYLYGGDDNDRLYGGFGRDILVGGTGNDQFYLYLMNRQTSELDIVTDFASGDKIRVNTISSAKTTLEALKSAANIRWTQNSDYSTLITPSVWNDSNTNDTIIYHTKYTASTSDDFVLMVLEDYNTALTITDFAI